jgi:hypothetical protein
VGIYKFQQYIQYGLVANNPEKYLNIWEVFTDSRATSEKNIILPGLLDGSGTPFCRGKPASQILNRLGTLFPGKEAPKQKIVTSHFCMGGFLSL